MCSPPRSTGWDGSRCANDENGAIAAVVDYGERYQTAVRKRMALPGSVTDVRVVSRARGGADTDFGVPGLIPGDDEPVDARQLKQLVALLQRCWDAFDAAAAQAKA